MSGAHYKHLTWQDRLKIDRMNREGMKPQQIADALRVHNSTIYRELERGTTTRWPPTWRTRSSTSGIRRRRR